MPNHPNTFEIKLKTIIILSNSRPTEHNGFANHETYERDIYETAQKIGESGHDCDEVYSECENSILNKFSYLMTT